MGHDPHDHDHGHHHDHDHRHRHDEVPREHREHAPAQVACYAITCSDTRTPADDEGGKVLRSELEKAGHTVLGQAIVKDEAAALKDALEQAVQAGARAIVLTGGTGIGRRDVTFETVSALFEKTLDGFGELFRMLSYQEIGAAAMMSRAFAGTVRRRILIALPGSEAAVRLAMTRLILPELGHMVREATR